MGRPIYVHEEEEEATKKVDQECRTWRSFARRLERQPYVLRDIAPTLDASEPSDSQTRETGVASQTSESGELPGSAQLQLDRFLQHFWKSVRVAFHAAGLKNHCICCSRLQSRC